MKKYLMILDQDNHADIDVKSFVDALDQGAEMFSMDDRVCVLKTALDVAEISSRLLPFIGSSRYFISDISTSAYQGRMYGAFWDFFKESRLQAAAE